MASNQINTLRGAILLLVICLCSCTKYNYIDGGIANGIHDCTMWEYFQKQSHDWDSTMIMIEHAGMKSYFDGSGEYKQITFLGVTDITIARYMLENNRILDEAKYFGEPVNEDDYWYKVTDIPVSTCQSLLRKLIIPQRILLKDIPKGTRLQDSDTYDYVESGGTTFTTIGGSELFVWMEQDRYADLAEKGAKMFMLARRLSTASNWRVASTDIQTNTGTVQALGYDFNIMNF